MTPKEKAEELVSKYENIETNIPINGRYNFAMTYSTDAETYALIAVDEIISTIMDLKLYDNSSLTYWIQVKEEIEKL